MSPIKDAWESYRDSVMPKDAGPVQLQECQRAFFAGAYSHNLITTGIGSPGVTEKRAMEILDAVQRECREFAKSQSQDPERN